MLRHAPPGWAQVLSGAVEDREAKCSSGVGIRKPTFSQTLVASPKSALLVMKRPVYPPTRLTLIFPPRG